MPQQRTHDDASGRVVGSFRGCVLPALGLRWDVLGPVAKPGLGNALSLRVGFVIGDSQRCARC
eukprot:9704400-Alexandrium_andersonii.AAC.1